MTTAKEVPSAILKAHGNTVDFDAFMKHFSPKDLEVINKFCEFANVHVKAPDRKFRETLLKYMTDMLTHGKNPYNVSSKLASALDMLVAVQGSDKMLADVPVVMKANAGSENEKFKVLAQKEKEKPYLAFAKQVATVTTFNHKEIIEELYKHVSDALKKSHPVSSVLMPSRKAKASKTAKAADATDEKTATTTAASAASAAAGKKKKVSS